MTQTPYAPPKSLTGDLPSNTEELWNDGKTLVMTHKATLPDRCIKCNQPAEGYRLKRHLVWHSPWLYLLILIQILLYIIVALIVRKRATIEIGLCKKHRRIRKNSILINWLIFLLGLAGLFLGLSLPNMTLLIVGVGLVLVSLVVSLSQTITMVYPQRINNEYIWLRGVSKKFITEFPEFYN